MRGPYNSKTFFPPRNKTFNMKKRYLLEMNGSSSNNNVALSSSPLKQRRSSSESRSGSSGGGSLEGDVNLNLFVQQQVKKRKTHSTTTKHNNNHNNMHLEGSDKTQTYLNRCDGFIPNNETCNNQFELTFTFNGTNNQQEYKQQHVETSPVKRHNKKQSRNTFKVIEKAIMLKMLHLSQSSAAYLLNVSMSTLKRRFYDLKEDLQMDRWPQFYEDFANNPNFNYIYPMRIPFILNESNRDEKDISKDELDEIIKSFRQSATTSTCTQQTNHSSSSSPSGGGIVIYKL